MSSAPSLDLRSSWPALVRQEERPRTGPDLPRLEQLIDQAGAATGAADRGDLARVLERCLGRLLARMDQAPGDERLPLKEGLIVSAYSVQTWARLTAEKLRPTIRKVGP